MEQISWKKCPKATGLWEMRLNICVPVGLSLKNSKHAALCELLDVTDGACWVNKIKRCSRLQQGQ